MTTTEDRERTRNQLQGLAELARQVSPDSSGYVDLSAFSSDPLAAGAWVDSALSRSRGSEPPKIDRLDAESMRPVALESLLDPVEVGGAKTARMQKAFIIMSSVCIAGLAVAAIALALRSPAAPVRAPRPVAAAAVAAPPAATMPAAPLQAADPAPVAVPVVVAADTTAMTPQAPQGTPGSSKHPKKKLVAPASGSRVHNHDSSSSATASLASPSPASSKSGKKASSAGSDSLMGAIQQSIAAPASK
jgi:hypothetical protein